MKIVKTASGKQTIKLSKKEWKDIGKKAGWIKTAEQFIVVDNEFNRAHYSDIIGEVYDNPPSYAMVEKYGSDPWESIPDELVQHVARIARKQGEMVNTKKEAYNYALQDEDALELLLPYADFDI
jgi:hypothetical protein